MLMQNGVKQDYEKAYTYFRQKQLIKSCQRLLTQLDLCILTDFISKGTLKKHVIIMKIQQT